ncbi:MAG: hypothetical protein WCO05_02505 [Candidatus Moraniibacteriota bacterium]|jgi:hypothetical protein
MPKEVENISSAVMDKIHKGQIKMRPRSYFLLGSLLVFIGLVASSITAIFLVSLMSFLMRTHGPMGQFRLEQLLSSFSLWVPLIAILALIFGVVLLKKFDFSYKKNFWFLVLGFVLAIIATGWVVDMAGLDDIWLKRGPMRGMMRNVVPGGNLGPGQNCGGCNRN